MGPALKKINKNVETLDLILSHAATLFWQKGIDHVTFAEIAKKVGVSQPALYAHVKNKMDLLGQVCLLSIEKGRSFIDSKLDPKNRGLVNLKAYVEANLCFFYEQKVHSHSLMALYYFAISTPELNKLYQAMQQSSVSRMSVWLTHAQNEGLLTTGCETQVLPSLHALLVGYSYKAIYCQNQAEYKKIQQHCWNDFEKLLSFHKVVKITKAVKAKS